MSMHYIFFQMLKNRVAYRQIDQVMSFLMTLHIGAQWIRTKLFKIALRFLSAELRAFKKILSYVKSKNYHEKKLLG